MTSRATGPGRVARALALALLLPGCIDLPDESKDLIQVFIVVLSVNCVLQMAVIVLLVVYFIPFTRPKRKPRRRRK